MVERCWLDALARRPLLRSAPRPRAGANRRRLRWLALAVGSGAALAGCFFVSGDAPTAGSVVRCMPGTEVEVACGCRGLGSCGGDPVLTVCDGAQSACGATNALAENDDACGLCPSVSVVCPPSGALRTATRGAVGRSYACTLASRTVGPADGGRDDAGRAADARVPPGWMDLGTLGCVAGQPVRVGCGARCGLGSCTGDPLLRVCDGAATSDECARGATAGVQDDDSCGGLCPLATLRCPPSGSVRVLARAYTSGEAFTCDPRLAPATPPPDVLSRPDTGSLDAARDAGPPDAAVDAPPADGGMDAPELVVPDVADVPPSDARGACMVGTSTRLSIGGVNGIRASVAWTGSEFGVAYREGARLGAVYFARFTRSGTMISTPVAIADGWHPSLVWTGSQYGLAWNERDGMDRDLHVHLTRFAADGSGRVTTRVSTVDFAATPSLVWNGSEFGLAWSDQRTNQIVFARVTAAGAALGVPSAITTGAAGKFDPSAVWVGSGYGVAWRDFRNWSAMVPNWEIYYVRLDATGAPQGSELRLTNAPGTSGAPRLAWSGAEIGMVWQDDRGSSPAAWFTRFPASGMRVAPEVRLVAAGCCGRLPDIAWTGREFWVSWVATPGGAAGGHDLFAAVPTDTGIVAGTLVRATATAPGINTLPALASSGREHGVAWLQDDGTSYTVRFTRIAGCL